jgi:hypothetical protein
MWPKRISQQSKHRYETLEFPYILQRQLQHFPKTTQKILIKYVIRVEVTEQEHKQNCVPKGCCFKISCVRKKIYSNKSNFSLKIQLRNALNTNYKLHYESLQNWAHKFKNPSVVSKYKQSQMAYTKG